jgi:hypothetical protein
MPVVVFLKKYIAWFALMGFIAVCTGCASGSHRVSADSGTNSPVPNELVAAQQASASAGFNTSKPFSSPGGYDPDRTDATKSAQTNFKKIYDKYNGHTEKLTETDKQDGGNASQSIANNNAINLYQRNHLTTGQLRSLFAENDCLGQRKTTVLYGRNWKPIGHRKNKMMRPAKSNAMLRSFFYNRPVSSAGRLGSKHFAEHDRLNSRYDLLRGAARLSQYTGGVSTLSRRSCEPKLSIFARNNPSRAAKKAQFNNMITQAAQRHQVDEKLVHAVIQTESAYNANATSSAGAVGLMQLMPDTAKRYGVTDRNDPDQNINGGTRYLRYLLDLFNYNLDLAVAAYNAGEHAVMRHNNAIPPYPETRNYVRQVLSLYNR